MKKKKSKPRCLFGRPCPKCGGKTKRTYCKGEWGDCYLSCPLRGKEHFDLNCQECGYEFYEKVRPLFQSKTRRVR